MRGAWGGTATGPGGHRGARGADAPPDISARCPCGGAYRWLPREERGFLVPGSAAMRCEWCGNEQPKRNPAWPVEAAAILVTDNIVAMLRDGDPLWRTKRAAVRAHESVARDEFYRVGGTAWSPATWKRVREEAEEMLSLIRWPASARCRR